ncbi:phosphatase PAP2 family protein [Streptomyces graminilatus]|uniref:phosphatase PAP2 family protein n=1 Tax=Streptomyces graminilatus TaxID=1464070 RepID=UPI0006E34CDD|nr:phosphatase PAP2 family protein [Streptomyces graminilatus]
MTQHDPSTLSTHPDTPGNSREATVEPGPAPTTRQRISAPLYLLGFLAVYLIAVCNPFGQRAENALFSENAGAEPAWIYDWSGATYGSSAMPPLEQSAMPTLIVGMAVIVVVTLVRKCWWHGCAAAAVVMVTVAGTQAGKTYLPRPDLVGARVSLVDPSFPSGHVGIAAALSLGLALVASPRVRPYALVSGMLWLAVTGGAVLATYHHRPSDVLGTTLLACACYSLAARSLPPAAHAPGDVRRPRALPAVALALAAVGALVAGARDDSVTQSLVYAATAFLCASLFWITTADGPVYARRGQPRPLAS